MQLATVQPFRLDPDDPIQPEVGSIRYTYLDGSTREFRIRPFIHQPGDFPERFGSIADARGAVREHNRDFLGLAFGVFQAEAGAFMIKPLESQNGLAFFIDGPEHGARVTHGSADVGSSLVGIVGWDHWINLSDPTKRTYQPVAPFAAAMSRALA
jgi:hypothetical protein